MNKEKLFESFNYVDDDLLLRSDTVKRRWSFNMFLKPAAALAVVVLAVFVVNGMRTGGAKDAQPASQDMVNHYTENESYERKFIEKDSNTYVNETTGLVTYVQIVDLDGSEEKAADESTGGHTAGQAEKVNEVFITVNDVSYRVYNYTDDYESAMEDINYIVEYYLNGNQ